MITDHETFCIYEDCDIRPAQIVHPPRVPWWTAVILSVSAVSVFFLIWEIVKRWR
jgi:hypothetical protein